jgi:tripartite-type tricarboxylate transporter receptor subunit TctC
MQSSNRSGIRHQGGILGATILGAIMTVRLRLTIAAAAALLFCAVQAHSEDFPSRPVTLIVPWPAGGVTDTAIRALAVAAETHLGQPIVIENRPGVGGTLAPMQMAASGKPDGYVVSQIPLALLRAHLLNKTAFDPARDLTYIIGLTGYTFGVVVKSDAPWRTFQDFLASAKARPGQIKYASSGTGTTPHLTMVQIAQRRGIDWVHVPYKGSAQTPVALLGGHIDAVADGTSWAELVNTRRLRLLVTWGAQRTANWPNTPTLREIGIDLTANAPYGLAGPKGMDPMVVASLHDAFRKAMDDPSYREALRKLGQEPFYLGSGDYAAYVTREIANQERLIKQMGLKPE